MTPARAGALLLSVACLFPADNVHAQSAAIFAKAAARSAGAFDTLVTPGALNALRRIADDTDEKPVEAPASPPERRPAPRSESSARPTPAARKPAAESPAEQKQAEVAPAVSPDGARTITAIAARLTDQAVELRIVAGQQVPALSEPFRAGDHSRLFITFDDARLALASPPVLTEAGSFFAGMDIAERDDGVRIALDIATLGAYEMAMSGDTAVLRLTTPAPVAADVTTPAERAVAQPDNLAIAREAARAGWAELRSDAAAVAAAVGDLAVRAAAAIGGAAGSAWHATSSTATRAGSWLTGSIPFASIARALVLLVLLGAPPVVALRLLRRRQSAARATTPGEIVGLESHVRTPVVAQKAAKQPKQPKVAKQPKEKKSRKPAVTRTTADARLWAARTLADSGADVAEIARQTGLSREAAILLVRRADKQR